MILSLLLGGDIKSAIITLLMWLPIILFSLSFHESAHGLAAYKLGDPTARNFGRITLNPAKHFDVTGFIAMMLFGIGWAKPVPINSRNFENPKKGMALSALAGPVSNLLIAIVCTLIAGAINLIPIKTELTFNICLYVFRFFYYGIYLNVSLAVFNFIPVPPLDGSRIISLFLPSKIYFGLMKYERYIGIAFIAVVFVLNRMNVSVVSWAVEPIVKGMLWLVGVGR